jgi:hypothetical protein
MKNDEFIAVAVMFMVVVDFSDARRPVIWGYLDVPP